MQFHLTALALPVHGSMQLVSSHIVRTALANTGNINDINVMDSRHSMDGTAGSALLSSVESEIQTRDLVPHDIPDHPHCTYKGADSLMYKVFSKDFGRHDETSQDGCGNNMLLQLRKGTLKFPSPCI